MSDPAHSPGAAVRVPAGRVDIERHVIARAQTDPAFRARLLASPREALGELLGVAIPSRLEVRVVEERPDLVCIVLPVDMSGLGRDALSAMLGRAVRG